MKKAGIALLFLLVGLLYYTFNPTSSIFFPKCPFFMLTGLKCPGCGSQRVIHHLLHLDFASAFESNALLVISLPLIAILLYAEYRRKEKPQLYATLHKPIFIGSYSIVLITWWILRNIFNC